MAAKSLPLYLLAFSVLTAGFLDAAQEQKKRSGTITGELKAQKKAPNGKNTLVEVLAPGEEQARWYRVQFDPKVKGPIESVLKAVRAANVGDRVQLEWVDTGEGLAITSFQVVRKGGGETKEERKKAAPADATKEDPAATKLLAEARAARAVWRNFPGFAADLVVNHNGQLTKASVTVDAKGKVQLDMEEGELKNWTRRQLTSLVAHRLPGAAELSTPCAFADQVLHHPQGRAIRVLNDELHSSYRIRDRQILEVNRAMGETRFTITVLENLSTKEKQYLPLAYVVNTWDVKSNELRSSSAHHDTWTRVGDFDLPLTIGIVTATPGQLDSRSLSFSNHRLGDAIEAPK